MYFIYPWAFIKIPATSILSPHVALVESQAPPCNLANS